MEVAANGDVKDGFGLPLQSSGTEFWTTPTDPVFAGPEGEGWVAASGPLLAICT